MKRRARLPHQRRRSRGAKRQGRELRALALAADVAPGPEQEQAPGDGEAPPTDRERPR